MHIDSAPSIIVAAFMIIGFLVVALAYAKASYAKTQIANLRGDRDDLTARVERLESEKAEMQVEFERKDADLHSQLDSERNARLALERIVTGRDILEAINTSLRQHDENAKLSFKDIDEKLSKLVAVGSNNGEG